MDVELRKWIDHPHYRFNTRLLGRDEYGTWLGATAGTPISGPNPLTKLEYGFVTVVPPKDWWVASFQEELNPNEELYVDITTAARWPSGAHVTVIDLDLDIVRERDGTVRLLDEDEFAEHQIRYGYPSNVIERAAETARSMMEAVRQRREPFATVGPRWLETFAAG